MCQQCDDNSQPVAFCQTCSEYLCEECLTAHTQSRVKALRNHITIILSPGDALDVQPQFKKTYNCSIHPEEILKLYCKTCKSPACVLCFVGKHNGHDIENIGDKTRNEVTKTINNLVKKTKLKLKKFEDNLKYISIVEEIKSRPTTVLKAQINTTANDLIEQIEAERAELLKEIDDTFIKDLKSLWADKEFHETAITNMQGALSFAQRSLACQEDIEMLALCTQVSSRLKELSQLTWDSQDTEIMEITKLEFSEAYNDEILGELEPDIVKPVIEITTDQKRYKVSYFNSKCTIQVNATMKKEEKTLDRELSLSYHGIQGSIDNWHKHSKPKIIENNDPNSWTVTCTPPGKTHTIEITVHGTYGIDIQGTIKCEIY